MATYKVLPRRSFIQQDFAASTVNGVAATPLNDALNAIRNINGNYVVYKADGTATGYTNADAAIDAFNASGVESVFWVRKAISTTKTISVPTRSVLFAPGQSLTHTQVSGNFIDMAGGSSVVAALIDRTGTSQGITINYTGSGSTVPATVTVGQLRGKGGITVMSSFGGIMTFNGDILNTSGDLGFEVIGALSVGGSNLTVNGNITVNSPYLLAEGVTVGLTNSEVLTMNGRITILNKGYVARNQNGTLYLNQDCVSAHKGVEMRNGKTIVSCRVDTSSGNQPALTVSRNGNFQASDYFRLAPGHSLITAPGVLAIANVNASVPTSIEYEGELVLSGAIGTELSTVRRTLSTSASSGDFSGQGYLRSQSFATSTLVLNLIPSGALLITRNGVVQDSSAYTVSSSGGSTTITLGSPLANGEKAQVFFVAATAGTTTPPETPPTTPTGVPSGGTIAHDDALFTYAGDQNFKGGGVFEGTTYTSYNAATVTYTGAWNGNALRVHSIQGPAEGTYDVYVDNVFAGQMTCVSPDGVYRLFDFTTNKLSTTSHTQFEFRNTRNDPQGALYIVSIDCITLP